MGYRPPPRPLSPEEFRRRFDAGARTPRELDPEFHEWLDRCRREHRRAAMLLGLLLSLLLVIVFRDGPPWLVFVVGFLAGRQLAREIGELPRIPGDQ